MSRRVKVFRCCHLSNFYPSSQVTFFQTSPQNSRLPIGKMRRFCVSIKASITNATKRDYCKLAQVQESSFIKNIFLGRKTAEDIFPYPDALGDKERETMRKLLDPVDLFFNELENVSSEQTDTRAMKTLWGIGMFGITLPNNMGVLTLNNRQYARLNDLIGKHDLGVAMTLATHRSIGFKGIMMFGDEQQKSKYLQKMVSSGDLAAFCLTEPGDEGSDGKLVE